MTIDRFDSDVDGTMRFHPQGDYINYDDHEEAVQKLQDEIEILRNEIIEQNEIVEGLKKDIEDLQFEVEVAESRYG